MSRASRLLAITSAWALPALWVAAVLFSGPSDGTNVSPALTAPDDARWSRTVTVLRTHGDTPLRPGDVVLAVERRAPGAWLLEGGGIDPDVGETLLYRVQRPAANLDRIVDVPVPLRRYPLGAAVSAEPVAATLGVIGLAAASMLVHRRPGLPAAWAALAAAALVPCALTSSPYGLGVVDLVGGRGLWPLAGGEALAMVGLCAAVAVAVLMTSRPHRPRWAPLCVALPALAYAGWLAARLPAADQLERRQLVVGMVGPAAVGALLAVVFVLVPVARRAPRRDRLAARLVLLAIAGGAGLRLLLGDLPWLVTGAPLLSWPALAALVTVPTLACVVAAVARTRLEEVEPAVRRTLLQALVVVVVGGTFLAIASTVGRAADRELASMLTGGVLALFVLPLAFGAQRGLARLLYGERDLPRRVVSDLRRLDPSTSPEEALRETLELLSRRLRLSGAAVEVTGGGRLGHASVEVGELGDAPVTVDLVAGGTRLGRLLLETGEVRDPFGPRDRRLLEDVGAQVGAMVQAVTLNAELMRSRQELVAAREEERRRLRRDLHDGLGPSLATLAMRLEGARDLIPDDPRRAAEVVGDLAETAREEIAEVRRVVQGLRPPALDQLGLVSALRQRAEEHNAGARGTATRWRIEAGDDVEPLPAAIEVAAYRIVLEAVHNAVRHSDAAACSVRLDRDDGTLRVRIHDTGAGVAANRGTGVGLSSMRERAEELGGTFTVTSEPGEGTLVEARLPIRDGADG